MIYLFPPPQLTPSLLHLVFSSEAWSSRSFYPCSGDSLEVGNVFSAYVFVVVVVLFCQSHIRWLIVVSLNNHLKFHKWLWRLRGFHFSDCDYVTCKGWETCSLVWRFIFLLCLLLWLPKIFWVILLLPPPSNKEVLSVIERIYSLGKLPESCGGGGATLHLQTGNDC